MFPAPVAGLACALRSSSPRVSSEHRKLLLLRLGGRGGGRFGQQFWDKREIAAQNVAESELPQRRRRVIDGEKRASVAASRHAARLRDLGIGEVRLQRVAPQEHHNLGIDERDLLVEVWAARVCLVRRRVAVVGGAGI